MAEYINTAELIRLMKEAKEDKLTREVIECHTTIDIVFCKNCKHRRGGNCFREYPPGFNSKKDTDYCSKGERRTE